MPVLFSVSAFWPKFNLIFNHVQSLNCDPLFFDFCIFLFLCPFTHIPTWGLLLAAFRSIWWYGVFSCLVLPKMNFAFLLSHSPCGFQVIPKKVRGYSDLKPPSLNWKFNFGIIKIGGFYDNILQCVDASFDNNFKGSIVTNILLLLRRGHQNNHFWIFFSKKPADNFKIVYVISPKKFFWCPIPYFKCSSLLWFFKMHYIKEN